MKAFIVAAMALAFAQSSFAVTYVCQNAESDYRAVVRLKPGEQSTATLYLPHKNQVKMRCAMTRANKQTVGTYDIAFCDDRVADGGYSLRISGGGFVGIPQARVFEKSFMGGKVVASMMCHNKTVAHY